MLITPHAELSLFQTVSLYNIASAAACSAIRLERPSPVSGANPFTVTSTVKADHGPGHCGSQLRRQDAHCPAGVPIPATLFCIATRGTCFKRPFLPIALDETTCCFQSAIHINGRNQRFDDIGTNIEQTRVIKRLDVGAGMDQIGKTNLIGNCGTGFGIDQRVEAN